MAGFCLNLAKASKNGVFRDAVTNNGVEITHASTDALVLAWVRRGQNELLGAAVLEKASLLRHHKLLRAEYDTPSTTNDDGDHFVKQEGGCHNSTTCAVEYSSAGSKIDGAEPSVMIWGGGSVPL